MPAMIVLQLRPIRGEGSVVKLGRQPITIGRHPDNTIALQDERASRFHAVIEPDPAGGYLVRDLKSRNGTKVNDVKIEQSALRPGDVLRVGSHDFLLEELNKPSTSFTESIPDPPDEASDWKQQIESTIDALPPKLSEPEFVALIDANGRPSQALAGTSDGANAMRLLLQLASKSRATDIHIEPKGESSHVRLRVDGQMVPVVELPPRVGELIFGLIKTCCQMKTTGREAVQEGHFSARLDDRRVDFRVSFTPSVYGQKLVVRILDSRNAPSSLSDLGLAPYMIERVRRICEQDHGVLLTCGPTGSGKTTTLYNALRMIDRKARNVVTIEDPVEYQLDQVTQIPIDDFKGNTFGALLRSVLRQDPDVILVGEIRDDETARTAMQAAMTGHLVFSSVHAKDTIASVFRLLDLKVEPYLVANSLDLILAQRLVRMLCDTCKTPVRVSPGQASRLGKYLMGKTQVYAATGCAKCLRTGYRGRRALFELLDFTNELRDVILKEPTIAAMRKVIEQGHFTTLPQFGWRLVAEGVTSLDEVDHVAGQG